MSLKFKIHNKKRNKIPINVLSIRYIDAITQIYYISESCQNVCVAYKNTNLFTIIKYFVQPYSPNTHETFEKLQIADKKSYIHIFSIFGVLQKLHESAIFA